MLNLYSMPSITESFALMHRRLRKILGTNPMFTKTQELIFQEKEGAKQCKNK